MMRMENLTRAHGTGDAADATSGAAAVALQVVRVIAGRLTHLAACAWRRRRRYRVVAVIGQHCVI